MLTQYVQMQLCFLVFKVTSSVICKQVLVHLKCSVPKKQKYINQMSLFPFPICQRTERHIEIWFETCSTS